MAAASGLRTRLAETALSIQEYKDYPRWFSDLSSRYGNVDPPLQDVLSFIKHFGVSQETLYRVLNVFNTSMDAVEKEEFFALLRLSSHALAGRSPSRNLVYVSSAVLRPKSILSKKDRPKRARKSPRFVGDEDANVQMTGLEADPFEEAVASLGDVENQATAQAPEPAAAQAKLSHLDVDQFTKMLMTGTIPEELKVSLSPSEIQTAIHKSQPPKISFGLSSEGSNNDENTVGRMGTAPPLNLKFGINREGEGEGENTEFENTFPSLEHIDEFAKKLKTDTTLFTPKKTSFPSLESEGASFQEMVDQNGQNGKTATPEQHPERRVSFDKEAENAASNMQTSAIRHSISHERLPPALAHGPPETSFSVETDRYGPLRAASSTISSNSSSPQLHPAPPRPRRSRKVSDASITTSIDGRDNTPLSTFPSVQASSPTGIGSPRSGSGTPPPPPPPPPPPHRKRGTSLSSVLTQSDSRTSSPLVSPLYKPSTSPSSPIDSATGPPPPPSPPYNSRPAPPVSRKSRSARQSPQLPSVTNGQGPVNGNDDASDANGTQDLLADLASLQKQIDEMRNRV